MSTSVMKMVDERNTAAGWGQPAGSFVDRCGRSPRATGVAGPASLNHAAEPATSSLEAAR